MTATVLGGTEKPRVPTLDNFGTRIAAARQHKGGWNIARAARACGVEAETWRKWEETGRPPRRYEATCRQIAEGLGVDYLWLLAGPSAMSLSAVTDGEIPRGDIRKPGFFRRSTDRRKSRRRDDNVPPNVVELRTRTAPAIARDTHDTPIAA